MSFWWIKYAAVLALLAALSVGTILVFPLAEGFPQGVAINIERGTSSFEIAATLEAQRVIPSRWLFGLVRLLRPRATLMAGEYHFEGPMTAWEAFDVLTRGNVRYYPVTVPEGVNRFDIADILAETKLFSREDFLAQCERVAYVKDLFPEAQNLEGFLFPDTYYLDESLSVEEAVEMMTTRFQSIYRESTVPDTIDLTPYEMVTLASMIEKETSSRREHRLVSSVFHNRLHRRMLMQCDPTVVYGLILQQRYRGRIDRSDLRDPHPYNTYVHAGLPPGPIANPGREALEAAFDPAETNYLFFVAESRGARGHIFSETLMAHNRAVAQYRRSRRR